ncbi:MAG: hypothetical protein F4X81_12215 [Gammaproteobacteria bacterium]|nr:hypothetical protein [Gammaproteobacteria bacterium]MYE52219.1 hypothetical protein [Gammaproteobacteria bacterium]
MPNLSIKNVPEPVVEKLCQNAAANHRSLQDELMALVCRAADESAPAQVESGWLTVEQLRAESEATYPQPIATGPLAVDIIRRQRDA